MWKRIGLLVPSGNRTVESELLPATAAVGLHFGRIWMPTDREEDLRRSLEDLDYETRKLAHVGLDLVVLACTGLAMMRGVAGHARLLTAMKGAGGCPAATAAGAAAAELRRAGAGALTLVTPYPPWLARAARAFLEQEGFTVAAEGHLGLEDGMDAVSPAAIAELASRHDSPASRAVFHRLPGARDRPTTRGQAGQAGSHEQPGHLAAPARGGWKMIEFGLGVPTSAEGLTYPIPFAGPADFVRLAVATWTSPLPGAGFPSSWGSADPAR